MKRWPSASVFAKRCWPCTCRIAVNYPTHSCCAPWTSSLKSASRDWPALSLSKSVRCPMGDGWHACNRQPKFCKIAAVAAVHPPEQARPGASPGTLGEVLYADRSKPRVSETDWVRLVQSVAAGDQPALHALYERTHRVVFTLAMRITSNRE